MIRDSDTPQVQIDKLSKIVNALMTRVERSNDIGGSAYSLFQTATALEAEVHARTQDLSAALADLRGKNRELARANCEIERSRQNLVNALEAMQEGFALFSEDRLVICNRQFRNLLSDVAEHIEPGIAFEAYARIVSRSVELDLPEDVSPDDWFRFRMDRHGRHHTTFTIALRGDRWIQLSERRTLGGGVAIIHTDVTDMVRQQRREQEKIIDAQARLVRATFDHLSQGLSTFDADGQLAGCNTRFRELLSLPFELTRGGVGVDRIVTYLRRHEIFHELPEDHTVAEWLNGLRQMQPMRVEIRRKDGLVLDANFQRLPENGFIATFTDVTAERNVTLALKRANDTLEARVEERTRELTQVNRDLVREIRERQAFEGAMREAKEAAEAANLSKTRFLAAASHDLLQPINAAKLFISTLQETDLNPMQGDVTRHLARAFGSIESLLHALLDISRLDAGKVDFNRTAVPVAQILDPIRDEFQALAASRGLTLRVVPSNLRVQSDPGYLRRIAQNLVSNAVKHSHHGRILVGVRRRGGKAVLEVHDTGPGIEKPDQERIFDEFQRLAASSAAQGMGLGLSIVKRACAQLGHGLGLDSTPGKGSTFRVTLDIVTGVQDRPAPEGAVAPEVSGDALDLIVVVVENDPEVRYATTTMLESWGASVLAVGGTQDAVDSVADIGVTPDIIIADFHLDDADTGLRSIAAVRAATARELPAILVTADRTISLREMARDMNVRVLSKPVAPHALRAMVSRMSRPAP